MRLGSSFTKSKLNFQLRADLKPLVSKEELVFGKYFTDHMLKVEWSSGVGWASPMIVPFGPLLLQPSACVLHYGVEAFEGLKAYRGADGSIRLFRPMDNMKRLLRSCQRLALPEFNPAELFQLIMELLKIDERWVPHGKGYSLYVRPTVIGTHDTLGVAPAERALLFVICSPVGSYYSRPISLRGESTMIRSWPGGTGDHKIGGNYASGILPQLQAKAAGQQQILWLFPFSDKELLVTEVGTMNVFCLWKTSAGDLELVTPALDGTILPGVTRDSILELVKEMGERLLGKRISAIERPLFMSEIASAVAEGRMLEMFGSGTAALITPIQSIAWKDPKTEKETITKIPLAANNQASLSATLTKILQEIQYGERPFHDWSVVVS